jgi:hypothetical protein
MSNGVSDGNSPSVVRSEGLRNTLTSDMRALLYLFTRSIVNGIKRAFSSPKRLISVLVGLGYYVGLVIRPWDRKPDKFVTNSVEKLPTIDPSWVNHGLFIAFAFVSLIFAVSIFGFRNTFKPADVDVLFPTPVSNRLIMFFRLFRDQFTTLLLPLFSLIIVYKPALAFASAVRDKNPLAFSQAIQGGIVGWFLLSLAWVGISYAVSFLVAKYETKANLISKGYSIALAVFVTGVFAFSFYQIKISPSWDSVVTISSHPLVRIPLFIPWAATSASLGIYNGSPSEFFLGVGVMVALIVGSLYYASRLSDYMYDQAATRGFQAQTMRDMQRKGDWTSILVAQAQQGKFKKGRIAAKFQHLKFRGGWALIYKEILIQARTGIVGNIILMLVLTMFAILFLSIPELARSGKNVDFAPMFYLGMVGFVAVNFASMQAIAGYQETLRKVEVIKPLPLTPAQIAFFETGSKGIVSMAVSVLPFLVGFIYRPALWQYHISGILGAPLASLALVGVTFLIVVLFPDFDDPTQRSFRGIMQLLGMLVVLLPTIGIYALATVLHANMIVPALVSGVINIGILVLTSTLAGRFYADFNPTD